MSIEKLALCAQITRQIADTESEDKKIEEWIYDNNDYD